MWLVIFSMLICVLSVCQSRFSSVQKITVQIRWSNSGASVCPESSICDSSSIGTHYINDLLSRWKNGMPQRSWCDDGYATYSLNYDTCCRYENGVHVCDVPYNDRCTKAMYIAYKTSQSRSLVRIKFLQQATTLNKIGRVQRSTKRLYVNGTELEQIWLFAYPSEEYLKVELKCLDSTSCLLDKVFILAAQNKCGSCLPSEI